jgi:RNA polymerase-associated protein CTR9
MAEKSLKEALGDGLWVSVMDGKVGSSMINWSVQYKDQSFFHQLEEEGLALELHSNKVTPLFNYARLLEELHDIVRASLFYRFIIFKVLPSSLLNCIPCLIVTFIWNCIPLSLCSITFLG